MLSFLRPVFVGILIGMNMGASSWAQQVIPRFVHRFRPPAGTNFNVTGAVEDAQGRLWFATNEGVVRFDGQQFRVYHDPVLGHGDDYFHLVSSPDGRIWCKLGRGSALSYIDPKLDRIIRVPDSSRLVREYLSQWRSNYVFADAQATVWIALRRRGLIRFNPRTYAVEKVFDQPDEAARWITQDPAGTIWFTTNKAVYAYNPVSRVLKRYRDELGSPNRTQSGTAAGSMEDLFAIGIHARPDGRILVALSDEVDVIEPTTGQVTRLELLPNKYYPAQIALDFHEDPQGNTYFRTMAANYRYTRAGRLEQLEFSGLSGRVNYLLPSRTNRLWVSSEQTLLAYDLAHVRPLPALNLLDITVNGTRLEKDTERHQLKRDSLGHPTLIVEEGDLITLRLSPYIDNVTRTFRFRLEGYDQQWNVTEDATGTVSYQLSAGTYTLLLNRFILPRGWSREVPSLTLVVRPPFWKTGWFWAFVLVATGILGTVLLQSWNRRRILRQELARREFEAATLRNLDEMKSRFFTNITHELRTPLTIILNATEQLSIAPLNTSDQKLLQAARRNTQQLMRLINETLDMARLDAGKLERHEQLGDPLMLVEQVVVQFEGLADQKQLSLTWKGESPISANQFLYRFDADKLEKIIYNLLANAVKFTPPGGQVRVEGRISDDHLFLLRVADTGIGIAADDLTHIFERFHQVDSSSTRAYPGTGIGLALVKELTEWLGGTITIESALEKGSTFTLNLPLSLSTAAPRSTEEPTGQSVTLVPQPKPVREDSPANVSSNDTARPWLLIVEDNEELRRYMSDALSDQYQLITAENGLLGWEQALEEIPDLIVSDVMMPELDGYELVERLKSDERTSHIPVLLLTAKSTYESRLKGFGAGADDYVEKPFSLVELSLRIRNCLRTRLQWQRHLTGGIQKGPVGTSFHPELDREEQFLARLRTVILKHLTDESVDVDWLVEQAGMSRTQLHRKITALTGMSTSRFIHKVRLEKAVELLQTGQLNVAQVAQQVGYSSQSYFTKMFQEQYGYSPIRLRV
ncbi:response regulator [Spirosoma agri]|uniref:histidine kinase n=1 Tax=Spirosoma agri TaxID=1987381 RepID=A0A6M0IRX9_9BACT|nr:ATP-binding protein [Spirosoma agri]NEU70265.1 response regulator [Spirosoma agri]